MNDPGLDGPIKDAAVEADRALGKVSQNEQGHTNVSLAKTATISKTLATRWWYASTAFPLIAGTFGPLANAFSICALVQNWRVSIPPGGTEEHGDDIKDPSWLIAVNAISLVFAITANLSLLLNMAKRVRFEIAQPITILGFWIASLLLIGLLSFASTSGFHEPGVQDQALTQAFYYGIFAAGLYQIISYMMCITVWGAYRGKYSKNFELTVAQRTLMLQTMSFLIYLLVGALIFCHIEGWKFLDAVYWLDFTLLTVGIGDYAPATHLGRGLLFPIAIGGIIAIGLVISSIRSLVLDRGSEMISARITEKTRARIVKQVDAVEKGEKHANGTIFGLKKDTAQNLAQEPVDDRFGELKRRKAEFDAMRSVQHIADQRRKYMALILSTLAFAILWFVGAAVFWKAEKNQQWTYFEALYFSYTSILTIGYGDLYPMSNSGKPFFVFWSLLAVPTLTILISHMGDTVVKGIKDVTIWLGEISFLPNSEARTQDRLKRGLYIATLGKLNFAKPQVDTDEETAKGDETDDEWANFRDMHPGLVQIFDASDRKRINHQDVQALDRLAEAWRGFEEEDEEVARQKHDQRAAAAHHYRHLLISHIPKIYADTKLATPKKYSYVEWAFYLRLLGEDESNSALHGKARPPLHPPSHARRARHDHADEEKLSVPDSTASTKRDEGGQTLPKWSWIGQLSPLMQDKDEAEWILERLFEKLEESLREASKEMKLKHPTDNNINSSHDQPQQAPPDGPSPSE